MSIAVLAGLGNPGAKYRNTRHNIGFAVVEAFALRHSLEWKHEARFEAQTALASLSGHSVLLVKPETFMNASGRSIGALLRFRRLDPSALLAIHDDINLAPFRSKLSLGGSAGGHNGIADLIAALGAGFYRYRIGIGPKPHPQMDLADYVLGKFSQDEKKHLAGRIPDFLDQIELFFENGAEQAMNTINQRTASEHERNDQ